MMSALIFLISTFVSLFCAVLFIRAWIFWRRISFRNPYASFIYRVSDFIIVPVRKFIPSSNNIDFPSLLVAYVICLLQALIIIKFIAANVEDVTNISFDFVFIAIQGMLIFLKNLLSVVLWLCFIYALLSWINPIAPFQTFLRTLIEPVLEPIRRILPRALTSGPIDFSLMFLIIIIITLQIVIV